MFIVQLCGKNLMVMSLLHETVASGDIERLYDILEQNRYDKNERDEDWEGRTPLFWAVYNGHFDCVKVLLQVYIFIRSLLFYGLSNPTKALIQFLKAGANPTILNHNDKSPAHCAAATGDREMLKLLVDYGCDIRTIDKYRSYFFVFCWFLSRLIWAEQRCVPLASFVRVFNSSIRVLDTL